MGEFTSFVLCRIATFLFNLAAIFIMVDILKMEFFICKLAISVVVVVLNYVLSKLVIFTHKKLTDRKKECLESWNQTAEKDRP